MTTPDRFNLSTRQTRLEPARQRLKRFLQRLQGNRTVKNQSVYRVEIGSRVYKRIVFDDPTKALNIGRLLKIFQDCELLPSYVAHQGTELWVEFLEGSPVKTLTPNTLSELARIYAALYSRDFVQRSIESGPWLQDLDFDLDFLHGTQVLSDGLHAGLRKRMIDWTPQHVWVGYDYSDPRAANMLECADGSHRFIDVESLVENRLLGSGAVKACYRWLLGERDTFLSLLKNDLQKDDAGPPVWETMPFVELCSLSEWTRRSVLLNKPNLIRPTLFEDLLRRN